MKKKVLMVACVPVMIKHFNIPNIQILQKMGYQVEVAFNCYEDEMWSKTDWIECNRQLNAKKVLVHQVDFTRNAAKIIEHVKAYRQLKAIVEKGKYEFIHCHTPIAAAIARIVAHRTKTRILYTAHGFHFFKGAPLKNWLLYYPVEKFLSRWTDCLITINREDYQRAKKKFHAGRTEYVPGVGVDVEKFNSRLVDTKVKRESLGVSDHDIMLLSVGELSERENHEIVIRALKEFNNPKLKYYIVGQGGLQEHLTTLIKNYGLEDKISLLGYRTDISELCQAADLFVFPSKQEGLPVALMEAIACETPVICSKIRGNVELVRNGRAMFDADSVGSLVDCLKRCVGEKKRKEFRKDRKKETRANYKHLLSSDLTFVNTQINISCCDIGEYNGLRKILKRQNFAKELKIDAGSTLILSVGELNKNKNHSTVIKAIAKLGIPSVHYVIAGQGELKKELWELTGKLGIEGQIHLLGFRSDIADIMKLVDLYCLPSLREGLNVSLMEAMASGLICLAGDIRGNRDLFGEGMESYLVPKKGAKVWAEKIRECIGSEPDKELIQKWEWDRIQLFSEEEVMGKMQEIYEFYKRETGYGE
ncbi:MAG: glycosyltransferase [Lachnospiraceae bacterium]|nr:glycosyltransferase [Lachnospiraceae bacterium]